MQNAGSMASYEAALTSMASPILTVDGSSGAQRLEAEVADLLARTFAVWKERQKKYGCDNISRRGPVGILVRLDDKMARLDRVVSGKANPDSADETLLDTCVDIANYALMVYLCQAGKWPGWPHEVSQGSASAPCAP